MYLSLFGFSVIHNACVSRQDDVKKKEPSASKDTEPNCQCVNNVIKLVVVISKINIGLKHQITITIMSNRRDILS